MVDLVHDSLTVDTSGKRFPVKNFATLLAPIYHRCPITNLNHQPKNPLVNS
jgi:hypothetical protein